MRRCILWVAVVLIAGCGSSETKEPAAPKPRPEFAPKQAPKEKGKQTYDYLGSVSVIDVPDAARLAKSTETVNANNRLAYSVAGLEKPRPDARPVPVPARHGEPSVIKHVIEE